MKRSTLVAACVLVACLAAAVSARGRWWRSPPAGATVLTEAESRLGGAEGSGPGRPEITGAEQTLLAEKPQATARTQRLPLSLYGDRVASLYYPSGWMGDYTDIRSDTACVTRPNSGRYCIRVDYRPRGGQTAGWAGVFWLFGNSQWGGNRAGYDLSGARRLTFHARGEKGGERILEAKMGGIAGKHVDSGTAGIGPITLQSDWKKYEIDLDGIDLSYVSGGFCWVTSVKLNPEGCTFYLDDIAYE